MTRKLFALILFGIAFGFVEAAVVSYLRILIPQNSIAVSGTYTTILNLGFIAFIIPTAPILHIAAITGTETLREFATIVMLAAVAYLSADKLKSRFGAFMVAFAVWDIFYYIFLSLLTRWPKSVFAMDVYFLIPVAWVGPVITPIIISLFLLIFGTILYVKSER